jgi:hypothetical protein
VVGSPAKLRQVHGDEAERLHVDQVKTLRVDKLQGHTLIAAPRGFSSRDRLHDLLGRVPVGTVLDEPNPLLLRVRALAGEALAVLSDEYTAVGRPRFSYPIILSANNTRHCVPMYLRGHPGPTWGVHAAFLYVVEHLVEEEKKHPRAAALD